MDAPNATKRKLDPQQGTQGHGNKKSNNGQQWRKYAPPNGDPRPVSTIEPGDAGIWATCDMNREGKCVVELRDILEEVKPFSRHNSGDYAEKMFGSGQQASGGHGDGGADGDKDGEADGAGHGDIEDAIRQEVEEIKRPKAGMNRLVTAVRTDVQCLVFFKLRPPLDPVSMVQRICEDAAAGRLRKRSRFVKRLTPISVMGRATEKSLDETAAEVLAPHFHQANGSAKKFAIRPSIRNHNQLTRDLVIQRVAAAVGPGHSVDLTHYDLMILVDIHKTHPSTSKNLCGLSVVHAAYDSLKRYNLTEICAAGNKARAMSAKDGASTPARSSRAVTSQVPTGKEPCPKPPQSTCTEPPSPQRLQQQHSEAEAEAEADGDRSEANSHLSPIGLGTALPLSPTAADIADTRPEATGDDDE
ncbi:MAG: hypothetical protein M1826_004990 [Phylliscum demangeonii]|nr:MAG: hypothetical protein M1826_004990 [Phylliscum demangeonii]